MGKGKKIAPRSSLREIYRRSFRFFGHQHWWPGDTPLEIAVGAILTQGTSWANASQAVASLKRARVLSIRSLHAIPTRRLARLIRASGYFNQKADRLKAFARYVTERYSGQLARMRRRPAPQLREELLALKGIGPETADSILLYALGQPAFVVDAYTRRILSRHSLISPETSYEEIQALFLRHLPSNMDLWNDYHAQIVAAGKTFCRKADPDCGRCPLQSVGRLRLDQSA